MATAVDYDPKMTVLEARARYFADNDFGPDGGYGDRWVLIAKLGPIPLGFPNTPGRIRAVRRHDLHHLVTGYDTDLIGEAEIAAWELASGCERFPAAVILNTLALPIGVMRAPERIRRAFAWGCRSSNMYGRELDDAVLAQPLGHLRDELIGEATDADELTTDQRRRYRWTLARGFLLGAAVVLTSIAVLAAVVLGLIRLLG